MNSFDKIIAVARKILLPYNNGILRGCNSGPFCVNSSGFRNLTAKSKFVSVRAGSVGIPSAEGIAVSYHVKKTCGACYLAGLDEARSVVSSALAVFIKYEPVTFGSADREYNIAGDVKSSSVRIIVYGFAVYGLGLSVTRVAFNIITVTVFDSPAFEVM